MAALDQTILSIVQKWQISSFILGSLVTQVLMVVGGVTRTRGCRASQFVAWAAFNMCDYMATTALGALAQAASTQSQAAYAFWAPILLLHLGGPDNFSALQMDDSEVWGRQCLTLGLQLTAASYVMAKCALHQSWAFTLLSFCLLAAGGFKYAERIVAMKHATQAAITESVMPIYFYMVGEPGIRLGHPPSSHDQYPRFYIILRGEDEWYKHYQEAGEGLRLSDFQEAAQKARPKFITVDDVLHSKAISEELSLLCISYALYKMYKRRLSHLFMFEWRQEKVKELLVGTAAHTPLKTTEDVMRVLEAELGFLYDRLYTKAVGTAYSGRGITLRIASILLFSATWVYLLRLSTSDLVQAGSSVPEAKPVTLVLVSVALLQEVFHLLRILASDWARVWLVSTYTQIELESTLGERTLTSYTHLPRMQVLSTFLLFSNQLPRLGHLCWKQSVGQYSMADVHAIGQKPAANWLASTFLAFRFLEEKEKSSLEGSPAKVFKMEVVHRVIERCREFRRKGRANVSQPFWFLSEYMHRDSEEVAVVWALMGGNMGDRHIATDLEHLVMNCHVATLMCEFLLMGVIVTNNTSNSKNLVQDQVLALQLSKYAMYLIVCKTELLPCHAVIARKLAGDTRRALLKALAGLHGATGRTLLSMINEGDEEAGAFLKHGVKAVRLLQAVPSEIQRWKLLCDVWLDILIHMAYANRNPPAHLHELTKGGELLTHLWVLLGHLGYGEQ